MFKYLVSGIIVFIFMVYVINGKNNIIKENSNLQNSLYDSLRQYKDTEGRLVGIIVNQSTSNSKQFLELKSKDSTILELQSIVKENNRHLKKQGSVTLIEDETNVIIESETKVDGDTYSNIFNKDTWITGKTTTTSFKQVLDLRIRNKYSVVIGMEKYGFLHLKQRPFSKVTNYNPYTKFKTLKTYQVILPKPKKFGVGLHIGYGVNEEFKRGFVISIGVNYNFIRF